MNNPFPRNPFAYHRKRIFAQINGTKGNLTKMTNACFLSKQENEKLDLVIEALDALRLEYKKRHISKEE